MKTALIALSLLVFAAQGARAQDHVGHGDPADQGASVTTTVPDTSPTMSAPAVPEDHAADAYYDPAEMAKARKALAVEAGGMAQSMLLIDRLEWRSGPGADGYAWEAEGWIGGDIDRFAFKSRGEGVLDGKSDEIELQAGWLHALDPWFNLRLGVRQDLQPRPRRTHAVLAFEGLAPYSFKVEGELFLSQKGEVTARAEASYDQRITQSLILQPSAELNLSAQAAPTLALGSGFTSAELGLRLRYEFVREFAPYLGIDWERKLGSTAHYARLQNEKPEALRFVAGIRFWF